MGDGKTARSFCGIGSGNTAVRTQYCHVHGGRVYDGRVCQTSVFDEKYDVVCV